MDRFAALLNLANSIYAFNKLHDIYNRTVMSDNRGEISSNRADILPARVEMLSQMLDAVSQYSPESYKSRIGDTSGRIKLYNNTYRSLRQHIDINRGKRPDIDNVIKTLEIIRPMINGNNRKTIEKVLQISQIMKS